MCNACNHPPGCTCGWGGEGHLGGGGSYAGGNSYSSSHSFGNKNIKQISFDTFVNPNATCPICGEEVFYYQSPDGGKVYFDALGPPWPKHPCTDIDSSFNSSTRNKSNKLGYSHRKTDNWNPFIIETIIFNKGIIKISGESSTFEKIELFIEDTVKFPNQSTLRLFYIQPIDEKSYVISTFRIEEVCEIVWELKFVGYKNEADLLKIING